MHIVANNIKVYFEKFESLQNMIDPDNLTKYEKKLLKRGQENKKFQKNCKKFSKGQRDLVCILSFFKSFFFRHLIVNKTPTIKYFPRV